MKPTDRMNELFTIYGVGIVISRDVNRLRIRIHERILSRAKNTIFTDRYVNS